MRLSRLSARLKTRGGAGIRWQRRAQRDFKRPRLAAYLDGPLAADGAREAEAVGAEVQRAYHEQPRGVLPHNLYNSDRW